MLGYRLKSLLRQFTSLQRQCPRRTFSHGCIRAAAQLPPRPVLQEEDLEEAFLKGSGPGGQKIVRLPHLYKSKYQWLINLCEQNKTSSAVQLKHIPTGTVIKSQATRSRSQNRKIARRLLAEKIEVAEKGPESRTALKAEVKRKKKASKSKKSRRKHRGAEEGQMSDDSGGRIENERESIETKEAEVKEERT